ncbi:Deoxyguanosinetriphosphate triphosphohydrolase-like protein [Hyella patelloides LEGE 07179]|uniref:Deoxyguanosinetriphosphate triphosphohydrolase-like protein n=1 Tax=Hyella patelloides LEGE 07179 TaxID=945734 RepID=A0A563VK81_9CYAN|nr:dNTP triphosphohydrolase [Hyella patelloides]VEP11849.1 Deoxyguanosinetriphosphate triphosphohydrolase-like protein [Hyella patelloides LEGE 07179]
MSDREERQHNPFINLTNKPGDRRSSFQIDRDRILYSSAFRRLAQVTQVVAAGEGHVFHNRLTHSLKVGQVARRLAERLIAEQPIIAEEVGGIDPDVVEAAALAHDLGHPPFGHTAEEELDKCAVKYGLLDGFEGNAQSFRILTRLAIHRIDYYGLNLTRATLNAVLKYPWLRDINSPQSKRFRKYSVYDLDREAFLFVREKADTSQTIEASIMDFADDVTYSVHDLEDFYLAGLIPLELLAVDRDELARFVDEWLREFPDNQVAQVVKHDPYRFQNFLDATYNLRGQYRPGSFEQKAQIKRISSHLIQNYIKSVQLSLEYGNRGYLIHDRAKEEELQFLQRIVWSYVISNPGLTTQRYGQKRIIRTLFEMYLEAIKTEDLALIPVRFVREYRELCERANVNIELEKTRMAVDIIASFSEAEAVIKYRRLTGISQGSFLDYWE